jgi:hypothetical protein
MIKKRAFVSFDYDHDESLKILDCLRLNSTCGRTDAVAHAARRGVI